MIPTTEIRTRLRKLLNEVIPEGGMESDTRFLDTELDVLLAEAVSIYGAAAVGWTMKAGMLQEKIESYGTGQEKYDLTSMKDQLSHALSMAQQYSSMGKANGSSVILRITKPEVL